MDQVIKLLRAYRWQCPGCSWLNFEEPVPLDLRPDERQRIEKQLSKAANQVLDGEHVTFVTVPDSVECSACGTEYPTH